jgi:hypothetical protein
MDSRPSWLPGMPLQRSRVCHLRLQTSPTPTCLPGSAPRPAAGPPGPGPRAQVHRCLPCTASRAVDGRAGQVGSRLPCTSRGAALSPTLSLPPRAPVWRAHIGEIEAKDGLPSADRNNKATLLLTGPFRTAKSSAKDLTPLVLKLQYAKYRDALPAPRRSRLLRR